MKAEERRTLVTLSAVESIPRLTQRQLAVSLGAALGTANKLIQSAIAHGWVEVGSNGRRPQYRLTQPGLQEKLRLLKLRFRHDIETYAEMRRRIAGRLDPLGPDCRRIVVFGSGHLAEITIVAVLNGGFELVGIVDDELAGQVRFGRTVSRKSDLHSDGLKGQPFDVLVIASRDGSEALKQSTEAQDGKAARRIHILED